MKLTKIYNTMLHKAEKKLFDLWWDDLIKMQKKYIKVMQKILDKQYKETLKDLEDNVEIQYNDVFVDQEQFIDKDFQEDIEKFIAMIWWAFTIGIDQLNKLMAKEVTIEASFGLKSQDAIDYATQYSASRITNIDDYTRKRINNLVSQWVEKWWGYQKIADVLKRDYAFSPYRASLIASNEIGSAYIQWKDRQFAKYKSEYGQTGWKNWISHRDDRTTDLCLENDHEWWIEYDQEFPSWDMLPPRFPWCRCNITYRLFKPEE